MTRSDKFLNDTSDKILRLFFEYFDEEQLDSFARKALIEKLGDLLESTMDIGEEAFDTAFSEGTEQGREEMKEEIHELREDFKSQLLAMARDL